MGVRFDPGKVRRKGQGNPSLAALFQPGEGAIIQIPVDQIDPWRDEDGSLQPFHLYPPERMQELAENIKENGVITPCIVRPRNGRYQLIAGHNRTEAAKIAGLNVVPCMVKDVDDDMAAFMMVDSNLYQREEILPSERARAYELKMRIYRRRGYRCDLTGEERITAAQRVAEEAGDSARSVNRYARLTHLTPELLEMVDEGKIPVTAGSQIAGLEEADQNRVYEVMQQVNKSRISHAQAEAIAETAKREGRVDPETVAEILQEPRMNTEPTMSLSIPAVEIPKQERKRLRRDPVLRQMLLETVLGYLAQRRED